MSHFATAEIVAIAELEPARARAALSGVAQPLAAGADFYWSLPSAATP